MIAHWVHLFIHILIGAGVWLVLSLLYDRLCLESYCVNSYFHFINITSRNEWFLTVLEPKSCRIDFTSLKSTILWE